MTENNSKNIDYVISLPERTLRSLAAALGGILYIGSNTILPDILKNTKIYSALIDRMLQWVIQVFGGVEGVYTDNTGSFVKKKIAGNVLEFTGMLALRYSPVWMLAVIADISGGTSRFLDEIVLHAKKSGVLEENQSIQNVQQLLSILEQSIGKVSDTIDLPPLNVEELKNSYNDIALHRHEFPSEEELLGSWQELKDLAKTSGTDIWTIATILAGATKDAGISFSKTFIYDYYHGLLHEVWKAGFFKYFLLHFEPFKKGITNNYDHRKSTFTEKFISRIKKFLGNKKDPI